MGYFLISSSVPPRQPSMGRLGVPASKGMAAPGVLLLAGKQLMSELRGLVRERLDGPEQISRMRPSRKGPDVDCPSNFHHRQSHQISTFFSYRTWSMFSLPFGGTNLAISRS